jgi:probable rRNA maturation factor
MRVLIRKVKAILNALDSPEAELSLVLVDDERIAQLNSTYLHHTGPTNVISFPMREGAYDRINPYLLGDVVISMDTCAAEAEFAGLTVEERLDQLVIHGVLHLFGYDHINNENEARIMEAKSAELLTLIRSGAERTPVSRIKGDSAAKNKKIGQPKG